MRAFKLIFALFFGICIGPFQAAEVSGDKFAREIEQIFSFERKESLGVTFVVGNDLWLPGKQFEQGNDWLALVCKENGCALEPANLSLHLEFWQGHYDDGPTPGQRLLFKSGTAEYDEVSVWFRKAPSLSWLAPGLVTTYHLPGYQPGQLPGRGTLEAAIVLPDNESALLVPLLATKSLLNKLQPDKNYSWPRAVLQLRAQQKRQLLPGNLGTCSGLFHPRNYLLWAGDLDRDEKPDYLISYIDADGPVHLFLSSEAKPDQLVGLGGIYDSSPYGGECDGPEGFLYYE